MVTQAKLKVDKTQFQCNVMAGSSSNLKTDWSASGIAFWNRMGALKLLWESERKRRCWLSELCQFKKPIVLKNGEN